MSNDPSFLEDISFFDGISLVEDEIPPVPPVPDLPAKTGRPSDYTPEIALKICEELAEGATLRRLVATGQYPARSTIFDWLVKHDDFRRQYGLALQLRLDARADEILDIADDKDDDYLVVKSEDGEDAAPVVRENPTVINRSKVQINARQWLMAKESPRKYGVFTPEKAPAPANGDDAKEIEGATVIDSDPLADAMDAWDKAAKLVAQK